MQERKRNNKNKVVSEALLCFIEKGIEATSITEIASKSGLTERSIYRYFKTKSYLVLKASLLFWDETVQFIDSLYEDPSFKSLQGSEQIYQILFTYCSLLFSSPEKLIFIHEAELYLAKTDYDQYKKSKPPVPYVEFKAPLSKAIRKGIQDGSVIDRGNIELLYQNAYDSLLGFIQKMAINQIGKDTSNDELLKERIELFCRLLTTAFTS